MVVGTKDYTSPILGLDYIKLEFMRLGKTNLTYDVMVNCNHAMMEKTIIDGKDKYIEHLDEIYDRILKWLGIN